eukprot:EG_transcript_31586
MLSDQANEFSALLNWLRQLCVIEDVHIVPQGIDGYGRGAFAIKDLEVGETILSLPYHLFITEAAAYKHPLLGPIFRRYRLPSESTMCLHIMYEMQDPDSFWKEAIRVWPTSFSTPDYFNEEDLEHFHCSLRVEKILRRKDKIRQFYDLAARVVERHPARLQLLTPPFGET